MRHVRSLACVGLDPPLAPPPPQFAAADNPLLAWCRFIIEQTHPHVCAFKPNLAFFEAHGQAGMAALEQTTAHLRSDHPDIPIIGDAKRGDIGSTSEAHARHLFDELGFDAVTLNPYLGRDALAPFLERAERGCIIVCRTSNPGAGEFQALEVVGEARRSALLWHHALRVVASEWNERGNCLAVVGATRPSDLKTARRIAGDDFTFLAPGVGAQGGNLAASVSSGVNSHGLGLIVSSSRSITSAPNPAQAAADSQDQINQARRQ